MKLAPTLAALSIALALSTPALADPAKPAPQDVHFNSIQGRDDGDCTESKRRLVIGPQASVAACQKAVAGVQAKRSALKKPKPYEAANFDYYEAVLLAALGAAQSANEGLSANVCTTVEQAWKLRHGLQAVPKDAVTPEFYQTYNTLPRSMGKVITICRDNFGTPAGAPPTPPAA